MSCSKGIFMIVGGLFVVFIGVVMTMYGNFHTPFWTLQDARTCDFCRESREATLTNTRNCRYAGPVFIAFGVLFIVIGATIRSREKRANSTLVGATVTTQYTSTTAPGGALKSGPGTYPPPQTSYQQGYPQQSGYAQPGYPQQTGYAQPGYPLHSGYPPQLYSPQQGYPPPQEYSSQPPYPPPQGYTQKEYPQQSVQQSAGYQPPPYPCAQDQEAPPPYAEASAPPQ